MDPANFELFDVSKFGDLVGVVAQYGPVAIGVLLLLIAERRMSNSIKDASPDDKTFQRRCYLGLMSFVALTFLVFIFVHTYKQFEGDAPMVYRGELPLIHQALQISPAGKNVYIRQNPADIDTKRKRVEWAAINPPGGTVRLQISNRLPKGELEFGETAERSEEYFTVFKIVLSDIVDRDNILLRYNEKEDSLDPDESHEGRLLVKAEQSFEDSIPGRRDGAPDSVELGALSNEPVALAMAPAGSLAGSLDWLLQSLTGAAFAQGTSSIQAADLPVSLGIIQDDITSSDITIRKAASCNLALLLPKAQSWIEEQLLKDPIEPRLLFGLLNALNRAGEKPQLTDAALTRVMQAGWSKDSAIRSVARQVLRRAPSESDIEIYQGLYQDLWENRESDSGLAPYVWFARTGLMMHYNHGIENLFAYRDLLSESPEDAEAAADAALEAFLEAWELGAEVPDSEKIYYAQALYGQALLWIDRAHREAPDDAKLHEGYAEQALASFEKFLTVIGDRTKRYPYAHHINQAQSCTETALGSDCLEKFAPRPDVPRTAAVRSTEPGVYRVSQVGPGQSLSVRAKPIYCAEKVGALPHDSTGVSYIGEWRSHGSSTWGLIEFGKTKGWVNTRYLAPE